MPPKLKVSKDEGQRNQIARWFSKISTWKAVGKTTKLSIIDWNTPYPEVY